jgi:tetratricopeptide (TPR) repeat protein
MATFWANFAADGLSAGGCHAVNLLIHAGACLLLFGLARRTLESALPADRAGEAVPLALVTALVWGVHPLNTESVTYVSQRAESLVGLFYLATLYAFAASLKAQGRAAAGWQALCVAACALGMASKPVMVTAPVAVLLFDRAFGARVFAKALRRRVGLYAGLAATWTVLAWLLSGRHESGTSAGLLPHLPSPWTYFLTQPRVVVRYLRLAVWPEGLCLDYAWPPVADPREALWPGLAVTGLLALAVRSAWRGRASGAIALLSFLALAPSSSLIPIADCAFEHRTYVPLAGLVALAVVGVDTWLRKHVGARVRGALAAAVVCTLGCATFARNAVYGSEVAMWGDVVAKRPANLRARNDLAVALSEAGLVDEAKREYQAVLDRIPPDVRKDLDSGRIVCGGLVPSDAWAYHYFRAHENLGLLLLRVCREPREAAEHLEKALRVIPQDAAAQARLRLALASMESAGAH